MDALYNIWLEYTFLHFDIMSKNKIGRRNTDYQKSQIYLVCQLQKSEEYLICYQRRYVYVCHLRRQSLCSGYEPC